MTNGKRILIVEDDERLADFISTYLKSQTFEVFIEGRGDRAAQRVLELSPDLILLDIQLPGIDGLTVCRQIRPDFPGPIIMLTASGEEMDQVVGLEIGADNYLPKPVSPRVLLAHIRAALRRPAVDTAEAAPPADTVVVGRLTVDNKRRSASLEKRQLDLSSAEFDLLMLLAQHAGSVVSRETIFRTLRGREYDGLDRTIDARISKLRKTLGDNPKAPHWIKTIHGVGYILALDE